MDLCIRKAFLGGVKVAIRDLKRSGRPNIITADDKAWVISLACAKPTDYGYAAEKWTHMARSFLRSIRVQSKDELIQRLYKYIQEVNESPVIFRWKYRLDEVLI